MRRNLSRAGRNLVLLIFLALPLGIFSFELQAIVAPPEWMKMTPGALGFGDLLPGALWAFLVMAPSVFLGGIIHQLLLWHFPRWWRGPRLRAAILVSSLLIPAAVLAVEIARRQMALFSPWAVLPGLVLVLVYGIWAKPLPRASS